MRHLLQPRGFSVLAFEREITMPIAAALRPVAALLGEVDSQSCRMKRQFKRNAFKIIALVFAVVATLFELPAWAEDYPSRPIRVLSDSAPGSAIDVAARMVLDRLGKVLGQQIVLMPMPGASGAIAAHAASAAVPDGYTLFAAASSLFVTLPGKADNLPLVLPRDFLPVGSVIQLPFFLGASASSGITTLPELIARAKAKPGQIGFAASGIGRLSHLTGLLLEERAGIEFQIVPYSGGPTAALGDVIEGRVPVITEGYASLAGAFRAHTLNMLAVASTRRLSDFPDLPTVAETLPGFVSVGWLGVVAPLGTPTPIIQKVNDGLKQVLSEPDLAHELASRGLYVDPMTPPEVAAFITTLQTQWKPILEKFEASQGHAQ
jgi:tripartite-type tricarboxylate transporter receptor subunit TctC